jgi:MFS family permease
MNATTACSQDVGEETETLFHRPAAKLAPKVRARGLAATRINLASALGQVLGAYGAPGSILLTLFLLEWLRADKWQIGLVLTMTYLGPTFEPLGAWLVERFGRRRRLFLAGFLVNRLPFLLFAVIPMLGSSQASRDLGIAIVFTVIALTRVGCHLATPAWWSWVADLVPERGRARFFGCRTQCASAVTAASLIIGLTLLHTCGGMNNRPLVSALFAAGALFGILDILLYLGVPEPPFREQGKKRNRKKNLSPSFLSYVLGPLSFLRDFRAPFQERAFRQLILGMGIWSFSANLVLPFVPVYQRGEVLAGRPLGLGISFLSLAGLNVLASMATMLTARKWAGWATRLGTQRLVLVGSGYLFVNLAYCLIGPAAMGLLIALALVSGVLTGAWTVSTNQLLLAVAPRSKRSFFVSAYNFTNGWLMAGGPLLGGILADRLPVLGWRIPGGLPCCYFHLLLVLACIGGSAALVILLRVPACRRHVVPAVVPPGGQIIWGRVRIFGPAARRELTAKGSGLIHIPEALIGNDKRTSSCPSPF